MYFRQYYVNVICSGINFNTGVRDFVLITMIVPGASAYTSWRELYQFALGKGDLVRLPMWISFNLAVCLREGRLSPLTHVDKFNFS